jgi:transcriptional regulator with PAS, ATPase and Fis domain
MSTPRESSRWQPLLRESTDPLAILDDRRRVRFVNAAFESWSGLRFAELRGRICRPRRAPADAVERMLGALTPPEETLTGRTAEIRRRIAADQGSMWVDLTFTPFASGSSLSAMLVRFTPIPSQSPQPSLPDRLVQIAHAARSRYRTDELAACTGPWKRLASQLRLSASGRFPVLFHGPRGAGKEHWARTLHSLGTYSDRPFQTLDASLLPSGFVAESLFEENDRFGAVLVKHPEKLPHDLQARWADLISQEAGPRWFAASLELPSQQTGAWHPDLAAIFETFTIAVPALSGSKRDMPIRIEAALAAACAAAGTTPLAITEAAFGILLRHDWPGNMAELIDALRESALHGKGDRVDVGDLPFHLRAEIIPEDPPIRLDEALEQMERRLITEALQKSKNNKAKAAESLGIWRARLLRRMEQLGIGGGDSPAGEEPVCETPN